MIELKNITKLDKDKVILNNLSVNIGEGLTFLTGVSGSGKSTLLRILAGIDQEYKGKVLLDDELLGNLGIDDRSYLLNNKIGFIWQDYKLLNELTVLENIKLPTYDRKDKTIDINRIMVELSIDQIANKKVKDLSGGQRQRVAIARELMKNPDYILADEPTSALDTENAEQIMSIFRKLEKSRNVIVVTHDVKNILKTDKVIELDKGEIKRVTNEDDIKIASYKSIEKNKLLGFKDILELLKAMIGHHKGRFLTTVLTLMLGTSLFLGMTGDKVEKNNVNALDDIVKNYGDNILDISLVGSFMSASGSGDTNSSEQTGSVTQDVSQLYKKFQKDDRIQFMTYSVPFNDINIKVDSQEYHIKSSGNTPVINNIVDGRMANGTENEVVVPVSFIQSMGTTTDKVLGKEIDFSASLTVWRNNKPVFIPTQVKAKIVGVINTTIKTGVGDNISAYEIEDSFFFSEPALTKLFEVSEKKVKDANFIIRAKSPETLIAIKDELTQDGIVPLGNFEVIEDIIRLGQQSTEQTGSVSTIMSILVIVMVAAVYLISGMLRRKEYAIFKINGFDRLNLTILNGVEFFFQVVLSLILLIILSPALNIVSKKIFDESVFSLETVPKSMIVLSSLGIIGLIISEIIIRKTSIMSTFKVGKK